MSAGDFVRRAAANMSSTLAQASSTVTQVAQGRKRYDVSDDAVEKCNLTIKCTPSKDAATTSTLAIKAGYLMKRNEQGQWQRRYICTVPHLFLYYFDSDTAEAPRGIIDLELYTNISRHKNFLKVATNDEDKMRSFHFQCDDNSNLNDWQTHFMRDRYYAVCDERNEYQHMQAELTGVLETIACQTKAVEIDKDVIEKQLKSAEQAKQEAISILQNMLTIVGITEEEMVKLYDLNRIAQYLENTIIAMKNELKSKYFGPDEETINTVKRTHCEEIKQLQEELDIQKKSSQNIEILLLKTKKLMEIKEIEYNNEINTIKLNFHNTVTSKIDMEQKNIKLIKQKKILIKEIKNLRHQNTNISENLTQVEGVNTKLFDTTILLQKQIIYLEKKLKKYEDDNMLLEEQYKQREQAAVSAAVVAAIDSFTKDHMKVAAATTTATEVGEVESILNSTAATTTSSTSNTAATTTSSTSNSNSSDTTLHSLKLPLTSTEAVQEPEEQQQQHEEEQQEEQEDTVPVVVLSTEEVQGILHESQAIMASLRPLPGSNRHTTSRSASPTGSLRSTGSGNASSSSIHDSPRGFISASHSANSLIETGLERQTSMESSGLSDIQPLSPSVMKEELGWLSPEQQKRLVETQQKQQSAVDARYRYLSCSNTTSATADFTTSPATVPAVDASTVVDRESEVQEEQCEDHTQCDDDTTINPTTVAVSVELKEHAEQHMSDTTTNTTTTTTTSISTTNNSSSMSMSMFSGAMSLLSGNSASSSSSNNSSNVKHSHQQSVDNEQLSHNPTNTTTATTTTKRPVKGIISSMFQAVPSTIDNMDFEDTGNNETDDPERLPSAMRLHCLRCAGTVEGPKYSTCSCSVPALMPEDLTATSSSSTTGGSSSSGSSSGWGFSGMFSKSSSVFKESLAKASQVTASNVEGLMSMTKAAATAPTASSTAAAVDSHGENSAKSRNSEGYSYYSTVVSPGHATAATTIKSTTDNSTVEAEQLTEHIESDSCHTAAAAVAPEKELWDLFNETAPPIVSPHSDDESNSETKSEISSSELVEADCADVNAIGVAAPAVVTKAPAVVVAEADAPVVVQQEEQQDINTTTTV